MKNKLKIYYSLQNAGDGSVYIDWVESQELATWLQESDDEGWAEDCSGYVTIESESPITFSEEITTIDELIKERENDVVNYVANYGEDTMFAIKPAKEIEELKKMKGL